MASLDASSCERESKRVRCPLSNEERGKRGKLIGGNVDDFFADGRGNRLAVFFEAGEIAFDGVANVGEGFGAGFALRNAAGQIGAFDDKHAVLVLLDPHSKAKLQRTLR